MNLFREWIQGLWWTRVSLAAFFIYPGPMLHRETIDQLLRPICSSNFPSIKLEEWFVLFS